jgi:hypothetical protein
MVESKDKENSWLFQMMGIFINRIHFPHSRELVVQSPGDL